MSIHDYWKTIVLTIWNFVAIVMSLLFNTLSRFVIASFQGAYVLISWLQSLFPLFLHLFAMKWWNWILWPPDVKSWLLGKDPDDGKDWRQEEKGTTRGWDGWIASPTWWTWVWENSRRRWRTGKPGVLQFMGLQRVRHDWETERQQQQIQLQNEY